MFIKKILISEIKLQRILSHRIYNVSSQSKYKQSHCESSTVVSSNIKCLPQAIFLQRNVREARPNFIQRRHYGSDKSHKSNVEESLRALLHRLSSLEDATRVRGYSTVKPGLLVLLLTGIGSYLFADHIRENVADEVTSVATKSLGDETLQEKAQELAIALLYTIYNDPNMQTRTVQFLKSILHKPETKDALIDLLAAAFQDEHTKNQLLSLLMYSVTEALNNESFRKKLGSNLRLLLTDPNTKAGILAICNAVLQDDTVKHSAQCFLKDVLSSEPVTSEATRVGKSVVQGVVNDPEVQRKTGDGLWSALGYTVRPRWFQKTPVSQPETSASDPDVIPDDNASENGERKSSVSGKNDEGIDDEKR